MGVINLKTDANNNIIYNTDRNNEILFGIPVILTYTEPGEYTGVTISGINPVAGIVFETWGGGQQASDGVTDNFAYPGAYGGNYMRSVLTGVTSFVLDLLVGDDSASYGAVGLTHIEKQGGSYYASAANRYSQNIEVVYPVNKLMEDNALVSISYNGGLPGQQDNYPAYEEYYGGGGGGSAGPTGRGSDGQRGLDGGNGGSGAGPDDGDGGKGRNYGQGEGAGEVGQSPGGGGGGTYVQDSPPIILGAHGGNGKIKISYNL